MLSGVFFAAAALLVVGGVQKLADPQSLVRALRSVGVPVPKVAVRLLSVAEIGLGTAALLTGNGVGVALSYAAFTGFVLVARSRGGVLASCGCFGKVDVRPTRLHAAVTGGLALAAAPGAPGRVPLEVPLLLATAAVAVTGYLVMAALPQLDVR